MCIYMFSDQILFVETIHELANKNFLSWVEVPHQVPQSLLPGVLLDVVDERRGVTDVKEERGK